MFQLRPSVDISNNIHTAATETITRFFKSYCRQRRKPHFEKDQPASRLPRLYQRQFLLTRPFSSPIVVTSYRRQRRIAIRLDVDNNNNIKEKYNIIRHFVNGSITQPIYLLFKLKEITVEVIVDKLWHLFTVICVCSQKQLVSDSQQKKRRNEKGRPETAEDIPAAVKLRAVILPLHSTEVVDKAASRYPGIEGQSSYKLRNSVEWRSVTAVVASQPARFPLDVFSPSNKDGYIAGLPTSMVHFCLLNHTYFPYRQELCKRGADPRTSKTQTWRESRHSIVGVPNRGNRQRQQQEDNLLSRTLTALGPMFHRDRNDEPNDIYNNILKQQNFSSVLPYRHPRRVLIKDIITDRNIYYYCRRNCYSSYYQITILITCGRLARYCSLRKHYRNNSALSNDWCLHLWRTVVT